MMDDYFEQFVGDIPYVNIWVDNRVNPLIDKIKLEDFRWTSSTITNRPGREHPEMPVKIILGSSQIHNEITDEIKRINRNLPFGCKCYNLEWEDKINFVDIVVRFQNNHIVISKEEYDYRNSLGDSTGFRYIE